MTGRKVLRNGPAVVHQEVTHHYPLPGSGGRVVTAENVQQILSECQLWC